MDALIRFARKVVHARSRVADAVLDEFHLAGFDDGAVAEVAANVAFHLFTNTSTLSPRRTTTSRLPRH